MTQRTSSSIWFAIFFVFCAAWQLPAHAWCLPDEWRPCRLLDGPHRISVGPQFYHVKRLRDGGSRQTGWLCGLRGSYERLKPNAFYWAAEGSWAQGSIDGTTASGTRIKSDMMDSEVEGRLGYNIHWHCGLCWAFTPFVGAGYYHGENRFVHPSPLEVLFVDTFKFGTAGFLLRAWCDDCWTVGFNFKVRQMYEGRDKVVDPEVPNTTTIIEDKMHYICELPIQRRICIYGRECYASVVPFYEHRHLGGREDFPFDFIDTKYKIHGVRLFLGTSF